MSHLPVRGESRNLTCGLVCTKFRNARDVHIAHVRVGEYIYICASWAVGWLPGSRPGWGAHLQFEPHRLQFESFRVKLDAVP